MMHRINKDHANGSKNFGLSSPICKAAVDNPFMFPVEDSSIVASGCFSSSVPNFPVAGNAEKVAGHGLTYASLQVLLQKVSEVSSVQTNSALPVLEAKTVASNDGMSVTSTIREGLKRSLTSKKKKRVGIIEKTWLLRTRRNSQVSIESIRAQGKFDEKPPVDDANHCYQSTEMTLKFSKQKVTAKKTELDDVIECYHETGEIFESSGQSEYQPGQCSEAVNPPETLQSCSDSFEVHKITDVKPVSDVVILSCQEAVETPKQAKHHTGESSEAVNLPERISNTIKSDIITIPSFRKVDPFGGKSHPVSCNLCSVDDFAEIRSLHSSMEEEEKELIKKWEQKMKISKR